MLEIQLVANICIALFMFLTVADLKKLSERIKHLEGRYDEID